MLERKASIAAYALGTIGIYTVLGLISVERFPIEYALIALVVVMTVYFAGFFIDSIEEGTGDDSTAAPHPAD